MTGGGVGGVYTIGTDVPLLGDIRADIPVEAITLEALTAAKVQALRAAPVIIGGAFVLGVASALSGIWVARRLG